MATERVELLQSTLVYRPGSPQSKGCAKLLPASS
jgi:hypothetical protein